jgi:sugar diacid utilization regulator
MGIAGKKYSNVDKKTAEILVEAKLLLEEEGYEVSKPREKSIAQELMNAAYGNAFKKMSKDPDLTVRKICLKAIEDKFFDICLDTLIKGPKKRAAFDNESPKTWTEKTVIQGIKTKGHFKRFKLIEQYIKIDMSATRALLDPDYRPHGDKVAIKKIK